MRSRSLVVVLLLAAGPIAGCASDESDGDGGTRSDEGNDPVLAWTSLADVPTARTEVSAVVYRGDLVVLGGFADGSMVSAAVEAMNLSTGEWRTLAPLPVPLHHAPALVADGRIHILGGYTMQTFTPTTVHLVYDGESALWSLAEPLPSARGAHGAALVDGWAYLVGGVGPEGLVARVDVLDIASGAWFTAPDLPVPRDHLAVVALDGRVHAIGGRERSLATNTGTHHALTPRGEWEDLPSMPTARGGIGGAVLDGRIVVVGGEEDAGTFDAVEAYDATTSTWESLPALPTPRHGLGVTSKGGTLYVAAGGPEPGLTVSGALEVLARGP